ncbi:hypothetical protein [Nostoc sp.]|uniref:hypothetical protein n=1 Tax=Nostoc sp. TaxID=1180 RepID=UPI002FFA66C2
MIENWENLKNEIKAYLLFIKISASELSSSEKRDKILEAIKQRCKEEELQKYYNDLQRLVEESGDSPHNESIQRIPDEAFVVRGGRNLPEDIRRGTGTHPCGVTGISVECALGLSVKELAINIPHRQVGVTTVGEVRKTEGDVIRTSGRSPHHATLSGLTPEQISNLLMPTYPNPAREQ